MYQTGLVKQYSYFQTVQIQPQFYVKLSYAAAGAAQAPAQHYTQALTVRPLQRSHAGFGQERGLRLAVGKPSMILTWFTKGEESEEEKAQQAKLPKTTTRNTP